MIKHLAVVVALIAVGLMLWNPVAGMLVLVAALWVFCLAIDSLGGMVLSAIMAFVLVATLGIAYLGCAEGRGRCCEVVEMVESVI